MAKLTDLQLILLSKAAQRDDSAALIPDGGRKAAYLKVGSSLVTRKLMREIRAKPGMPVWRMDEDERPKSLVILQAGREAIGVEDEGKAEVDLGSVPAKAVRPSSSAGKLSANSALPRAGSKQALVIAMLSRKSGATLDALIAATGWLPHTMRAALTGLRKRGFVLDRQRNDAGVTSWRIVQPPAVKQAA